MRRLRHVFTTAVLLLCLFVACDSGEKVQDLDEVEKEGEVEKGKEELLEVKGDQKPKKEQIRAENEGKDTLLERGERRDKLGSERKRGNLERVEKLEINVEDSAYPVYAAGGGAGNLQYGSSYGVYQSGGYQPNQPQGGYKPQGQPNVGQQPNYGQPDPYSKPNPYQKPNPNYGKPNPYEKPDGGGNYNSGYGKQTTYCDAADIQQFYPDYCTGWKYPGEKCRVRCGTGEDSDAFVCPSFPFYCEAKCLADGTWDVPCACNILSLSKKIQGATYNSYSFQRCELGEVCSDISCDENLCLKDPVVCDPQTGLVGECACEPLNGNDFTNTQEGLLCEGYSIGQKCNSGDVCAEITVGSEESPTTVVNEEMLPDSLVCTTQGWAFHMSGECLEIPDKHSHEQPMLCNLCQPECVDENYQVGSVCNDGCGGACNELCAETFRCQADMAEDNKLTCYACCDTQFAPNSCFSDLPGCEGVLCDSACRNPPETCEAGTCVSCFPPTQGCLDPDIAGSVRIGGSCDVCGMPCDAACRAPGRCDPDTLTCVNCCPRREPDVDEGCASVVQGCDGVLCDGVCDDDLTCVLGVCANCTDACMNLPVPKGEIGASCDVCGKPCSNACDGEDDVFCSNTLTCANCGDWEPNACQNTEAPKPENLGVGDVCDLCGEPCNEVCASKMCSDQTDPPMCASDNSNQ